jgi:hypothetical protein
MKKILLSAVSLLLLVSCSNDETSSSTNLATTISGHEHHRGCASHEVLEQQLRENPELAAKMQEIERFTQNAITNGRLVNGKIEIPVVVNSDCHYPTNITAGFQQTYEALQNAGFKTLQQLINGKWQAVEFNAGGLL